MDKLTLVSYLRKCQRVAHDLTQNMAGAEAHLAEGDSPEALKEEVVDSILRARKDLQTILEDIDPSYHPDPIE
jgi:hypothetical protein